MNTQDFEKITQRIFRTIFDHDCPYNLEELKAKFAPDLNLPQIVHDSTTGEDTYTTIINGASYITNNNMEAHGDEDGWMLPKQDIHSLSELVKIWEKVNAITTERVYNSDQVVASDPIYNSSNVYNSTNCNNCKNILYCSGSFATNYSIACQRSGELNYCIRVDDSNACSNSCVVICSGNISNSFFIQDASHLHECMFCSHISHHEYCIANMQFSEAEYKFYKAKIIEWILAK